MVGPVITFCVSIQSLISHCDVSNMSVSKSFQYELLM